MVEDLILYDGLLSSSSDDFSDENDDERMFINVVNDNNNRNGRGYRRIPRVVDYIETVIVRYNMEEFRGTFRLRRPTFDYVLFLIGPDLQRVENIGNITISPEKQLYVFLMYLGTKMTHRSIANLFGVGKSTAWEIVFRCVAAIYRYRNYFIKWPTQDESRIIALNFQRRTGFPNVNGLVDGTEIKIPRPTENSAFYFNRKKFCSIKLQVTCNHKLEFTHCFAGFPGGAHDARSFKYSGLQGMCTDEYFYGNYHLLGDSAYTLQNHLLTPYQDNGHLTPEQTNFNRKLCSTRIYVECSIGLLKMRWRRILDLCPINKTEIIPYYIIACCILHNICLKNDNEFEYPVFINDEGLVNMGPSQPTRRTRIQGSQKRNQLRDFFIINL